MKDVTRAECSICGWLFVTQDPDVADTELLRHVAEVHTPPDSPVPPVGRLQRCPDHRLIYLPCTTCGRKAPTFSPVVIDGLTVAWALTDAWAHLMEDAYDAWYGGTPGPVEDRA